MATSRRFAGVVEGRVGFSESMPASSVRPPKRGRRLAWLDALKVLATLQMVQGHTIDGILSQNLRTGPAFDAWTWARGLTAVAFLFAAGVAFFSTTLVDVASHLSDPQSAARRIKRGAVLMVIGYLLRFPPSLIFGGFSRMLRASKYVSVVDILQCVGLCIIFGELLVLVFRSRFIVALVSFLLSAFFFFYIQPASDWSRHLPLPISNYFTVRDGSLFPLFPWASYFFSGIAFGAWIVRDEPRFEFVRMGVASLALYVFAWKFLDSFELRRFAWVLIISSGLSLLFSRTERLPRFWEKVAQETLSIYVIHILIVYMRRYGLAYAIGKTVPVLPAVFIAGVLVVVSTGAAFGLRKALGIWRSRSPREWARVLARKG